MTGLTARQLVPRTHVIENRKLMNSDTLCDQTFGKSVTCNNLKGRLHAHRACNSVACVHCFLSLSGKPREKDEIKLELANQQKEMAGNSLYMEVLSVCGLST